MPEHIEKTLLSDRDIALVQRYARLYGLDIDEAASALVARRLKRDVQRMTGHGVCNNVRQFRRGS